jgi:hypothetical protein
VSLAGFWPEETILLAFTIRMVLQKVPSVIQFLLSCVPHDTPSCNRHRRLADMYSMHDQTIWAYRAHVRLYRGEGKIFQDAQHLALVGKV